VNSDDDIKTSLGSVVLFQADAEKGEGKDLAQEFNVKVYPTFIVVNADGQTLDRWAGYGKESFMETLADAMTDLSTIEDKMAAYEKKPTAGLAVVLGRYSSALRNYADAVNYFTVAQKLNDDPSRDYTYEIFKDTFYGSAHDKFSFDDVLAAAHRVLEAEDAVPEDVVNTAMMVIRQAKTNDRQDVIEPYLEKGLEISSQSDDPRMKDAHSQLMIEKSLLVEGNEKTAVKYKKTTMPEGWKNDPGQLNSFAWWCFENNIDLKEAEKLSRRSVELAEPGRQKAMNLDTLAEICNALDNHQEAVELTKLAINEDPDNKYYKDQLDKFEKSLTSHQ
jgi:tetratricopeptide (TPR) repeat protein